MMSLFSDAFPRMQEVYTSKADATFQDFIDVNKVVQINRRSFFDYDVLIQPDLLKIFRLLDPTCELKSHVDLSKSEAEALAQKMRDEITRRLPQLGAAEENEDIRPLTTRILWGTYSLLEVNKMAGIRGYEPYYVAVPRSI